MLQNIAKNLRAIGPAAALIAWMSCFTALSLFGTGSLASYGQDVLGAFGVFVLLALAQQAQ